MILPVALDMLSIYQLATGNQNLLLPKSTWIWIVLSTIGLLVIPFVAFHKVRKQRDILQGQLDEVKARKPELEILEIKDEIPFWETEKAVGQESFWLRLGVRNNGQCPVTQCGGTIVKLLDATCQHIGHDQIPLHWIATYRGIDEENTLLRPNESGYLDVLVQKEKSPDTAYFAARSSGVGGIEHLDQVPSNATRLLISIYGAEIQPLTGEFEIQWKDKGHSYKSLRLKPSTLGKRDFQL